MTNNDTDKPSVHFVEITSQALMGTSWCVKCLPDSIYAQVIHKGDSLCLKHYKELHDE